MTAIDNIRRDLQEARYLHYSPVPFAGAIHDFKRPLRERLKRRELTGPYYWNPTQPGKGRGFYQSSKGLFCDKSGSTEPAALPAQSDPNEHLLTGEIDYADIESGGDGKVYANSVEEAQAIRASNKTR
jgi:hypothetical protein